MLLETFYPEVGGGETQARLLSEGLVERGLQVLVLTRRSARSLPPFERIRGVPVYRLPPAGRGRLRKWGLLLTALPALFRTRGRYDVLLVCGFRILGVPAVFAGKLFHKPCILKADSNGEMSGDFFAAGLARWRLTPSSLPVQAFLRMRNGVLRGADAFVPLSSKIADELRAHGVPAEKIHPIPNCVDTARFQPVDEEEKRQIRQELQIPLDDVVLAFTGRLVSYKGLPLLLRVWREIRRKHEGVRLILVGSGGADLHNCEAELKQYVTAHRLEDSVRFTGAVDDVQRYLQASDVFVFPTQDEAFGISLVEAMACGLAAVTTSTGGIEDIARHRENAWLVRPGDFDELHRALDAAITDRALVRRLGEAALRTARSRYTREAVTAQYVELFRRVLGNGSFTDVER